MWPPQGSGLSFANCSPTSISPSQHHKPSSSPSPSSFFHPLLYFYTSSCLASFIHNTIPFAIQTSHSPWSGWCWRRPLPVGGFHNPFAVERMVLMPSSPGGGISQSLCRPLSVGGFHSPFAVERMVLMPSSLGGGISQSFRRGADFTALSPWSGWCWRRPLRQLWPRQRGELKPNLDVWCGVWGSVRGDD